MKAILRALFAGALVFLMSSCEKDTPVNQISDSHLGGFWISPEYHDSLIVYVKAAGFNDGPGFEFKSGGSMVERKNAGWCGTPPVTYDNYNGSYTLSQDGVLEVVSPYWGGITRTRYSVIYLDQEKLTLMFLESGEAK